MYFAAQIFVVGTVQSEKSILKTSNYLITIFLKLRSIDTLTYLLMFPKCPQILITGGGLLLRSQANSS